MIGHGDDMRRVVRGIVLLAGIVVLSIPLTIVVTIMLLPLWAAIERRWGIESIGHSGPADWCFWAVFAICIIMLLAGARWMRRPPDAIPAGGPEGTP